MFDFIKNIGSTEIIVIVVILVLIFGARAIRGLGKTSGETVKEMKEIKKEFTKAIGTEDNDKKPGKN